MASIKEAKLLAALKDARKLREQGLTESTKKISAKNSQNTQRGQGSQPGPSQVVESKDQIGPNSTVELINLKPANPPSQSSPEQRPAQPIVTADDDDDTDDSQILTFSQVVGHALQIFRLIQLLCENQNKILRDYLREQPDNLKSYNIIKEITTYLGVIAADINDESIQVAIQLIDTLNETSMGNVRNQMVLFESKVLVVMNQLLGQPATSFPNCSPEEVAELKLKAANLLKNMVEDNSEASVQLAKQILTILDLEAVFEIILLYNKSEPINEDYTFQDVGFLCAIILARLKDLLSMDSRATEREKKMLEKRPELFLFSGDKDKLDSLYSKYQKRGHPEAKKVIGDLLKWLESIEIMVDGEVQKIYFFSKERRSLTQALRNTLLFEVNRESPTERVRDFVDLGNDLLDKVKLMKRMESFFLSKLIIRNYTLLHYTLLFWTFLLNGFILFTWHADNTDPTQFPPFPLVQSWYMPVLYALGGVHIFLSFFAVIGHFLTDPPMELFKNHGAIEEEEEESEDEEDSEELSTTLTKKIPAMARVKAFGRGILGFIFSIRISDIYFLAFLVMSALGLVYQGYTYCFHLLHILINNDILSRTLQSVTKNGTSLLWVAALVLVIIYIYTIAAFAFYRDAFSIDSGLYCETLWQCFVTSVTNGLQNGLGGTLAIPTDDWTRLGLKVIFDLSFYIIISVIGLNIVFGIIVDTFAELRDEKFQIEEDMLNVCFICSLPSSDFDRLGEGFIHHVKKEHNMWAYLLYFLYLSEKNPDEYSDLESYVSDMIENDDTSWFPINRALALSKEDNTLDDKLDRMMEALQFLVNGQKEEEVKKKLEAMKAINEKWKEEARKGAE